MRSFATPMIVDGMGTAAQSCLGLEALPLRRGTGSLYDEGWLQCLIQEHPALLPIDMIEPALAGPVPICMELPVPSGFIDNLMITRSGGLIVVETKLWRNPEARREVVGQILDYAKDLSRWSYEDLQRAVRTARREPGASLFELTLGEGAQHEEAGFIDAVSRNLRLGRMLLIVAGDGIQESAEHLTDFLQRHMGLHFTLAMVEMSLWRDPFEGRVLVQPRVLTRTVQIERAVIRLEQGVSMSPVSVEPARAPSASSTRPSTLTSEAFYEALAKQDPSMPPRLQAFLDEVEPMGVFADIRRQLNLKWRASSGTEFSLGAIDLEGRFNGDYANWAADSVGRLDLAHQYQEALAALMPGASIRQTPKPTGWRLVAGDGRNPEVGLLLTRTEGWLAAMSDFIRGLDETVESRA